MADREKSPSQLRLFTVIVGLSFLTVAAFLVFWALDTSRTEKTPSTFAYVDAVDDELIERGRYLALAGNCASCHTTNRSGFMAGGVAFETPFGKIYSTNITSDAETGIGQWTGEQFFHSMRNGVRPNGEHLYPAFPYTAFTRISDKDIFALFSFLKTIPAVRQQNLTNELSFPFNIRSFMSIWKGLFFKRGAYQPINSESLEWNRGAYLVDAFAHCSACHSPRNLLGAEQSDRKMMGGIYNDKVRSGNVRPWSAPNLTSAANGLGLWPLKEVADYLKTGKNAYVATFGPMNEVILNSTQYLNDGDISAMAIYLKSLPPGENHMGSAADSRVLGMGRTIYNLHCGTCHLPTGLGDKESAPQLAGGSLVVQASNPASLINVILDGPEMPDPPVGTQWLKPMEDFRYLLDDEEIAALASYLRGTWGNTGGEVTADQVARQR